MEELREKRLIDLLGIKGKQNRSKKLCERYSNLCEILELNPDSKEADSIFKWIEDKKTTLKELCSNSFDKFKKAELIRELAIKQNEYYCNSLKQNFEKKVMKSCRRLGDVQIEVNEYSYKNRLYFLKYGNKISEHNEKRYEIDENLFRDKFCLAVTKLNTMQSGFDDFIREYKERSAYLNPKITLLDAVNETMKYYYKAKDNQKNIKSANSDNPYLRLFIYIRSITWKKKIGEFLENEIKTRGDYLNVINDNGDLLAIEKYFDFIGQEYKELCSALNHVYQEKIIDFLSETIGNIDMRSMGIPHNHVFWKPV